MESNGDVLSFLLQSENLRLLLLFNSLSLVVDYNYKFGFGFVKAEVNIDSSRKRILDCVLYYVHAHLLKSVAVSHHKLWQQLLLVDLGYITE